MYHHHKSKSQQAASPCVVPNQRDSYRMIHSKPTLINTDNKPTVTDYFSFMSIMDFSNKSKVLNSKLYSKIQKREKNVN